MHDRRSFDLAAVLLLASFGASDAADLQCLYRFDRLGAPTGGGTAGVVRTGDGGALVGAESGLARIDDQGTLHLRPADGSETGPIREILLQGTDDWLIGAENGYYVLSQPGMLEAKPAGRADAERRGNHVFAWLVVHPCVGVLPDAGLIGARLEGNGVEVSGEPGWQEAVVERPGADGRRNVVQVHVTRELEAEGPGAKVIATLGFRPSRGAQFQPIAGSKTEVEVGWGPWDYAKDALWKFGPWALAAQVVLFGGLLVAARRRVWAWNVVTAPFWGKVGLWFWAGLRFVPAIAALGAGALGGARSSD